ncbi:DHH family phosphoesterase [Enterococcus faecalis]
MEVTNEILAVIKNYQTIIIQRHQRPDPDAIGSQAGLAAILNASFPDKRIFQVGGPVEGLEFLAEMDTVDDNQYQGALVIVTDTANAPRISDERYRLGEYLIKIDHHPNDEPYGDLMWVNPQASSCSEMIADFYFEHQAVLTLPTTAARLLYAGIVGDTGRFLYPATSAHTLAVAAKLRAYDFDATVLNRELDQMPLKVAKLAGYLYQHLEIDENGAARVILPQKLLTSFEIADSETAAIVALPGMITEVVAWGIFVQQPQGHYRVRLRSKGPVINELAKAHHGGGHPLASGANAKDITEAAEIYQQLQALCQSYKNSK